MNTAPNNVTEIERSTWTSDEHDSASAATSLYTEGNVMVPAQSIGVFAQYANNYWYAFATSQHAERYEEFPITIMGFDY